MSADLRAALCAMGSEPHPMPLERNGMNPKADLRYFRAQVALQRRLRPDLVLNYTIKPNIWGSFAARLTGCKAVSMVTGAGYLLLDGKGVKRRLIQTLAKRLYRAALSGNEAVIFQNRDDVADFVDARIVQFQQARMVSGSGVNLAHFRRAPLPPEPVFLMIARLLRTKGVQEYAQAAEQVRAKYPNARFLLVGMQDTGPDGIDTADLARWQARGLEYLGELVDVRPVIAASSVYVLPSYREGTPRSVLEAMAMGRPIITTDVPGCRETVQSGSNGFLVPARDSVALAGAMEQLIGDASLRAKMGEAAYALAAERFDVEVVNRDLIRHMSLQGVE
jgi:glycosyltransferase involved in cell wall biosynthesis